MVDANMPSPVRMHANGMRIVRSESLAALRCVFDIIPPTNLDVDINKTRIEYLP